MSVYPHIGTVFQKRVWGELEKVKYGKTQYYSTIAKKIKTSPRAVGNACGANKCLLIIGWKKLWWVTTIISSFVRWTSSSIISTSISNAFWNDSKVFFYPDLDQLHDPFLMQDMERAVDRILTAMSDKQTILVFGDYDVDGTTSAAFLTLFFRSLDVDIHFYIPSREEEGYWLSIQGIDYAKYIGANILQIKFKI